MDAFLDNEPLRLELSDGDTLASLVAAVNREAAGRGRAVIGIQCNGQEIGADALTAALSRPLAEFARIELRSRPSAEVASAVLNQAAALIEETERDQPDIVELLNEGNTVRGMELLAGSFRLWQQAHEAALQAIRLGHVNLDDVHVEGQTGSNIIHGLKDKLSQIREALEARDYVMLADILQYEIAETVQHWKQLVVALRARLPAPP